MLKQILTLLFITSLSLNLSAQIDSILTVLADSTKNIVLNDSLPKKKKKKGIFAKSDKVSPKKALFLSLMLPGAGQAYNKRYWKIPIVYGALGGTGYAIWWNTKRYRRMREAYFLRTDGDETTIDEFSNTLSEDQIADIRDGYLKQVEQSYIGFFVLYTLQGMDAFVDAHLRTFDVSEDLSLKIKPNIFYTPHLNQSSLGFGMGFQLEGRAKRKINLKNW